MRKTKRGPPHFSKEMTDDQLIAFWIFTFGDRPVSVFELRNASRQDDDVRLITDELAVRGLVSATPDKFFKTHVLALKRAL